MTNFFIFGVPKSGTTWLQMLCDSHADISCRPEDDLTFFIDKIPSLMADYNTIYAGINQRTAQQDDLPVFTDQDATLLFRQLVYLMLFKAGKDIAGMKDNSIVNNLQFYLSCFPDFKFINIIRDPREGVVSSWHHNKRVEQGFLNRAKDLETWAGMYAQIWQTKTKLTKKAMSERDNFLQIRFEDLKADTEKEFESVCSFLGANTEGAARAVNATKFDKLKQSGNQFFRSGKSKTWEKELSEKALQNIYDVCQETMREEGYYE